MNKMVNRNFAPWPIPITAKRHGDQRSGYRQVSFRWTNNGWHYQARWHEPLPTATLITYPSWQLSRIHPGHGFGNDVEPRREEILVGHKWLPASRVRFAALKYNRGLSDNDDIKVLQQAHRRACT